MDADGHWGQYKDIPVTEPESFGYDGCDVNTIDASFNAGGLGEEKLKGRSWCIAD